MNLKSKLNLFFLLRAHTKLIPFIIFSVIRLILQFLKENQFDETATTLQTETSVKIEHIENKDQFIKEIKQGEWDTVLRHVMDLKIPSQKVIDLYEHIILELVELRELGAARTLLRQTEPMFILKQRYPERYLRLEHTLSRTSLDPREIYPHGATKEKRRQVIAQGTKKRKRKRKGK